MPSTTNIASCIPGDSGHQVFCVNKSKHLAILNIPDPKKAKGLSPKEIKVGDDTVDANPANNIGAVAWKSGDLWEVRVYFASPSKKLKELTWNSKDKVYRYGALNSKEYELVDDTTISAESQGTDIYVYCNLKKYSSDYNVVYQDGSGWNDNNMS